MRQLSRTLWVHGLFAAYLFASAPVFAQEVEEPPVEEPPVEEPPAEPPAPEPEKTEPEKTEPEKTEDERTRVLVLDLRLTSGLKKDEVQLIDDLITVELSRYETLDVLSGADVRRMVELEAEKQSVGCDDDGACLADIAGALGAAHAIYGRVGKLGSQIVMTLNLFDSTSARSIQRTDIRAADLDELANLLPDAVARLSAPITGGVAPAPSRIRQADESSAGLWYKVGMIGGGLTLAGATFVVDVLAESSSNKLYDPMDFVFLGVEAVGLTVAIVGLTTNPFAE